MASNLLVTGKWGEVHVTSAQQRNFNSGVVGDGQYVMNGLTATMSDSNTLHVAPGVACMNGADVEVPAGGVDVTVTNGTQGMLRNDLICMRYTMDAPTQKESVELVCVRGTPAATDPQDPEYNDGSILDGSLVVDMPLYRVPLDGISVGDPEPLFDVLMPMADLWDSVSQFDGTNKASNGSLRLPNGLKLNWGVCRANSLGSDSSNGGYSRTIGFLLPYDSWCVSFATAQYAYGFPTVTSHNVSTSKFTISCDVNYRDVYINWLVIGV